MASASTTSTRSSQPPMYPEIRPRITPRKMEKTTATTITATAVCAPQRVREYTSNPLTVVPHRNLSPGGSWVGKLPCASESCEKPKGASTGARSAVSRKIADRTSPATSIPRCSPALIR